MSDDGRQYDSGEQHTGDLNPNSTDNLPSEATTVTTTVDDSNNNDNNNNNNNNNPSTSSQMAKGLSYTISSIINDFEAQAQQTYRSQDQLSSAIDRLTNELDQLLADAPSPFIMQHATKISGVRKRVSSLNSVLKSIQRRVDNIDRLVSAGLPNDEIASGSLAER
ncbi:hypothetical protein M8C21_011954 [Ambrosia artemisiifolia]|uniref:Biogenesis of lysosome-related organelles complex 1 subunit 7 n=1 Tax=Ambrosia artemisiifolia TaxID=4212 RepID=A0AAD5GH30_AMBAR|nr:hypothetical protein M8C21_011954 [Ambrosia artemisiifolia]